jgi:hypothetical protein
MSLALPEDAANSGGGGVLFVADPSHGIWQAQGGQEVVRRGGWPKLPHVVAACQAVGAGQVVVAAGRVWLVWTRTANNLCDQMLER